MTNEFGVDAAFAVELFFEGEDDKHLVYALLHPAEAAALPGPELRADEPDDGNACAGEVFGEAEVDVGEIDEDGDVGALLLDECDELAVAGVDVGDVAEDFGDAHDGYVFGADDASLAGLLHVCAAKAGEYCAGQALVEGSDESGSVVVAGGFASGEKDARVGDGGDSLSLSCENGERLWRRTR